MKSANISLVVNAGPFSEGYLPSDLKGREEQLQALSYSILPAMKGGRPLHVWIYGKPGTGKTSTCKYFLKQLGSESKANGLYINCWENNSFFAVLDKMVRELRILGVEKLNTSFKIERLKDHLKGRPFILILDEIDKLPQHERDDILYNFCNISNIGIVAISNSKYIVYGLDGRIKSRLNPQYLEFMPYNMKNILNILNQRALSALDNGAYSQTDLKKIAFLANGDTRIAIQTLKNAVYNAELDQSKAVKNNHIKKAYQPAKELKNTYLLNKLTRHHHIFYDLIRNKRKYSQENCRNYIYKSAPV